jgi:hypothetical protein
LKIATLWVVYQDRYWLYKRILATARQPVTPEADGSSPFDPARKNKGLAKLVNPFFFGMCPSVCPSFSDLLFCSPNVHLSEDFMAVPEDCAAFM